MSVKNLKFLALSSVSMLAVTTAKAQSDNTLLPGGIFSSVGVEYRGLVTPAAYEAKPLQLAVGVYKPFDLNRYGTVQINVGADVTLPFGGHSGGERRNYTEIMNDAGKKEWGASVYVGPRVWVGRVTYFEGYLQQNFNKVTGKDMISTSALGMAFGGRQGPVDIKLGFGYEFSKASTKSEVMGNVNTGQTSGAPYVRASIGVVF